MIGTISLIMKIVQSQRHIMKGGIDVLFWENTILLNAGGEVGGEKLRD